MAIDGTILEHWDPLKIIQPGCKNFTETSIDQGYRIVLITFQNMRHITNTRDQLSTVNILIYNV